jgi:hypothetical protein
LESLSTVHRLYRLLSPFHTSKIVKRRPNVRRRPPRHPYVFRDPYLPQAFPSAILYPGVPYRYGTTGSRPGLLCTRDRKTSSKLSTLVRAMLSTTLSCIGTSGMRSRKHWVAEAANGRLDANEDLLKGSFLSSLTRASWDNWGSMVPGSPKEATMDIYSVQAFLNGSEGRKSSRMVQTFMDQADA